MWEEEEGKGEGEIKQMEGVRQEGGGEGMNQPRGQREDASVWGSLTVIFVQIFRAQLCARLKQCFPKCHPWVDFRRSLDTHFRTSNNVMIIIFCKGADVKLV